MRRTLLALSTVMAVILVAVFLLARLPKSASRESVFLPSVEAAEAVDTTVLAPSAREPQSVKLDTPLDPSVELWSRRTEARAIEPVEPTPRAFSTRKVGGGVRRTEIKDDPAIREHALSWCAIVGIAEEKHKDVADLVVRTQNKWKSLCRVAGSAQTVNTLELDGLREWRRDELGRIVGFEAGDALIAGIKAKQGF